MLLPMIILIAVSLIVPVILILMWRSRPGLAFVSATIIYLIPIICLMSLAGESTDQEGATRDLIGAIILFLFFGLPILALIQWKSRKNRKRKMQSEIDDAF